VLVGLIAPEGDRFFPDFVAFLESELRVEDCVFRLTRERALVFLSDVDPEQARSVVERLVAGFQRETAAIGVPALRSRYLEVPRGTADLTVKQVLPAVFASDAEPLD
jgi:GGDEF domain-containing protein